MDYGRILLQRPVGEILDRVRRYTCRVPEGAPLPGDGEFYHPSVAVSYTHLLDVVAALPKGNQALDDADPNKFVAQMGAEAIYTLLKQVEDVYKRQVKNRVPYPDLLEVQLKSFRDFFQMDTTAENRKNEGLYKVFQENFPITDRKSTRLNSSHSAKSRMPSSA